MQQTQHLPSSSFATTFDIYNDHLPPAPPESMHRHNVIFPDELVRNLVVRRDKLQIETVKHKAFQQPFRELAEYLAHLMQIRQKLRQRQSAPQLKKLEEKLRKQNIIASNFANSIELQDLAKQLRELAKSLANLRKLHRQLRRKSSQEIEELEAKLRKQNIITSNFAKYKKTFQWLPELEKYCEYIAKSSASQLRLQEKSPSSS